MRVRLLIICCMVLLMFPVGAQTLPDRGCATMEQDSINRAKFPQRGTLDEFEVVLQQKIRDIALREARSGRTQATIINIPVIVHVVHNGEPIGTGLNISLAQIQSQIEVLNEDFRKKIGTPGYNTNPVGADIEIEFCLSPVDQNGAVLAEPGVHRYNGGKASWTRNEIESQLKPTTIWNPNLFYNVWTLRFGGTDANLLGYAQFPDQSGLSGLNAVGGPASTDGVVVQFTSFGSGFPNQQAPYNKGRTLSHETGHWLGLRHIWGDGGCNADDFVSDTPLVGSESRGCPTNKLGCNGTTLAMVQNYMDYSDDACMNIFTKGQKDRILAVMELSPRRKTLVNANLCSPQVADVPTANFVSDKTTVLRGGEVNFTDLSTNFPTSWNWTFEGGDPNTSTARNPKVKYNVPGVYSVTLTATNTLGESLPFAINAYITVSEEGLCSEVSNFKATYTKSILPLSDFGAYTGYLTGHNSIKTIAVSEFFINTQGYEYVSGVDIKFGYAYAKNEDATVTVTVWNARGPQSAPGSVIEQKVVLLKQILDDIENNRPTSIVFDRETPVFSRPFQVGVEFNYATGDSIAIISSANGEATSSTSWIQNESSVWSPYSIALGANIAMDIKPIVGVNPSVQVSASKLMIYPGEEVVLNGRGASIFIWNADDGSVQNVAGPQLLVRPTITTTYTTVGSGLPLCEETAVTTIYVRDNTVGVEEDVIAAGISLYPNPGNGNLTIALDNPYRGAITTTVYTMMGSTAGNPVVFQKTTEKVTHAIDATALKSGVYIVQVKLGERVVMKKWIKY
ncbi:MAG: PKD domain-containing protein [Cyclobacteriaceae bacterium]|nr:PKD domain-containing protein [Cyclobacteriaceae bacterium]